MKHITYIYEYPNWIKRQWSDKKLLALFSCVWILYNHFIIRLLTLGLDLNVEVQLDAVTLKIVKTSETESETLNNDQVRFSDACHFGVNDRCMPTYLK